MTKPQHIAIIMDGNGRWAKSRGLKRSDGHLAGANAVRETLSACIRHEIPYISLYAFSSENWKRPQEEVNYLFKLFSDFVKQELPEMVKQGIRLSMIGEQEGLPLITKKALKYAIDKTKNGAKTELILALNYSGTNEIMRATKQSALNMLCAEKELDTFIRLVKGATSDKNAKIALEKEFGKIFSEKNYTEERFRQGFYHHTAPDPDLIIRTSGELRLSNFYLFQAAYAEFYFTDTLWPDFTEADFSLALDAYSKRKRRFGDIEEDTKDNKNNIAVT